MWKSVNDVLPKLDNPNPVWRLESVPVLVYLNDGEMCVAKLEADEDEPDNKVWYTNCSSHWEISGYVTHWQPLPPEPK